MKKIIALFLTTVLLLLCTCAVAETTIDKAEVGTQLVIWVLCGILSALGALATWAMRSYVLPWLKDVAVPWLSSGIYWRRRKWPWNTSRVWWAGLTARRSCSWR